MARGADVGGGAQCPASDRRRGAALCASGLGPAWRGLRALVAERVLCRPAGQPARLLQRPCWQRFPKAKRRLNQLQAEHISKDGVQPVRGPVRDALTLLDENGALLFAPDPLWQALRARDWKRLFTDLRPLWSQARLELVGHALSGKTGFPKKMATAHVYIGQTAIKSIATLAPHTVDEWLADDLQAVHLSGKPFAPMPVVRTCPDWWPTEWCTRLYDDAAVFGRRPKRQ